MKKSIQKQENNSWSNNNYNHNPKPRSSANVIPMLRSFRGSAGTLLLIHSLLSVLLQIIWNTMPNGLFGISKSGIDGYVISSIAMQGLCILLPTLFVIGWFKMPSDTALSIKKSSPGGFITAFTIGIPAAFVFIGLNNAFIFFLIKLGIELPSVQLPSWTAFSGPRGLFIVIIISVLLPGIIEELMFRGVIMGSMISEGGMFSAVFLQAIAFSLFHADPLFIVAPFLAGLLLGFIRVTTGSIYSCIFTHISLNLTILLMKPLLPRLTAAYISDSNSLQILYASILSACIAAVALIPMIIVLSGQESNLKAPKEKLVFFPADWKFFLACVILIATLLFAIFK